MQIKTKLGIVARTKPKHEHIAAANLRKNLGLDVFSPRLRLEKLTRRGLVSVTEPLFPCYIFVRCVLEERFSDIQHTVGVNRLVNFGGKYRRWRIRSSRNFGIVLQTRIHPH